MGIKELIEELIQQELDEFNAIGAGGVSATGGAPLGMNMGPAHKTMWSGDKPEGKKKVQESNGISAGAALLVPSSGTFGTIGSFGGDEGGGDEGEIGDENFDNVGERDSHKIQLQKFLWAGDNPGAQAPKVRYVAETKTTELRGIPIPQSEQEMDYLGEIVEEVMENVLDRMGLHKATNSVRRNMIGGGAVYMDRHDPDQKDTKAVMAKVSKNLHRKPYSHDPPRTGLTEE